MSLWLIYALGGGWGHLTRSAALARAARTHARVRILTNSPYADLTRRALPELDLVALDPDITVPAAHEHVRQHVEAAGADCLIVDTFPRGLGGELLDVLKSFAALKVLVARDLNPRYSSAFDLDAFIQASYDLVLDPDTPPWLVRSANELLPRDHAHRLLRIDSGLPCILVCAAGNRDELAWYGDAVSHLRASGANVRIVAPSCPPNCPADCWIQYWPAIDLYAAADVVIGGAGYNTIAECLACRVPLIARPWPRKYDRQWLRAARASRTGQVTIARDPEQAASAALRMIADAPRELINLEFENGADRAAALISSELLYTHGRSTQTSRQPAPHGRRAYRL